MSNNIFDSECENANLEILKLLVQEGYDIESINGSGCTCLMDSCLSNQYEITKCLIDSGADVNRTIDGITALHTCVKAGNLKILKLLLDHGAVCSFNYPPVSPLMAAAIYCQIPVVEFLTEIPGCTKENKIDAFELLGANIIDRKVPDFVTGYKYWTKAMLLRYEDPDCPLEKPSVLSRMELYTKETEVRSLEQMEDLSGDSLGMSIQALLVRERILGPDHSGNFVSIIKRGDDCVNRGNFQKGINLWMYILDVRLEIMYADKYDSDANVIIAQSFKWILDIFSSIISGKKRSDKPPVFYFKDMLQVFNKAFYFLRRSIEILEQEEMQNLNERISQIFIIVTYLMGFMCKLRPEFNDMQERELKEAVGNFVLLKPRDKFYDTPLHLACLDYNPLDVKHPVLSFPLAEVVDILLEMGASPNIMNSSHNTPLHILLNSKSCPTSVLKSLLKHGAHLDICNAERETPLQIIQSFPSLDICPLQYINLKCLSAQAVRHHNIPYTRVVHEQLEVFLNLH